MTPNEYKAQFAEIRQAARELAAKLDGPEYADIKELQRDTAQVMELWQRQIDLYDQMQEEFFSTDRKYFLEFCKRFDETMERHGQPQPKP